MNLLPTLADLAHLRNWTIAVALVALVLFAIYLVIDQAATYGFSRHRLFVGDDLDFGQGEPLVRVRLYSFREPAAKGWSRRQPHVVDIEHYRRQAQIDAAAMTAVSGRVH